MATPASLFRPGTQPEPLLAVPAPEPAPEAAGPAPVLIGAHSAGAVEFDTVISASGVLAVLPAVQRIKMGAQRAGQLAHVWADEFTVHALIGGQLVKTVPSCLDAEDLATLKMRGASPAGPPPAAPAPAKAGALPGGTVIEADRSVDGNGVADLAGHRVKVGAELAHRRVTLRLDGHLIHVICDGVLAKTLPSPVPAADRGKLRGARIAAAALPAPAPGPVSVQRKVPRDSVIMVTCQRLRVGATYARKIVTVHVEDTHFRVTCDGAEISLHPRAEQRPATRWKAKIHARRPNPRPASPEPVNDVVSRNCQGSPETTHRSRARSTGLGPVLGRPSAPAHASRQSPPWTSPGPRQRSAQPAATHAAAATRRLRASPAAAASRSSQTRSLLARAAGTPTGCRYTGQTGSRTAPSGHPVACGQDDQHARAQPAATAQSAPITRPGRSTVAAGPSSRASSTSR